MSINEQPLVTVYIPTFNRLELLQRAVESVRNQTYKNLEIIVVDDCSTDGTQKYLAQLAKEDSRVRYFLKEKNSGACVSRNIAIENAKGEFITGLDDDDYFMENRINIFVDNWVDNIAGLCSYSLVKKSSNNIKTNKRISLKNTIEAEDLLKANHIGNQIFTKSQYLKAISGFDKNMQVWQDLECWYRLLKEYGVVQRINKPLYVVDISHPHERISNKNIEKITKSYNFFVEKHKLNFIKSQDLYTHILSYTELENDLKLYWRRFLNFKSFGNFFMFLKKLLKFRKL